MQLNSKVVLFFSRCGWFVLVHYQFLYYSIQTFIFQRFLNLSLLAEVLCLIFAMIKVLKHRLMVQNGMRCFFSPVP